MSIEEIRSRISVINAETARLNTQRNQNIGRQQTLTKQLNDAFDLYKKNYGVELTTENLQSELDSVTKKKEEELGKIEQILSLINAGNIAEANKLAGIEVADAVHTAQEITQSANDDVNTENVPVSPSIPTPPSTPEISVPPSVPIPPSTPEVIPPAVETPVVPPVAPPVTPPIAPPVTETPVAPPVAPPITPPKTSPVLTGAESLEMGMSALEGFSKPSLGSLATPTNESKSDAPTPPKTPVQDFGAILNGTAFKPN